MCVHVLGSSAPHLCECICACACILLELAAQSPILQAPVLEADDPRVAWAAQNRTALQHRTEAEAAKKVDILATAKEHLDKVYQVGSTPRQYIVLPGASNWQHSEIGCTPASKCTVAHSKVLQPVTWVL